MLTTWSYSRYQTYTQCPAKAKYLYIDKLPEPSSPALDKGSMVHKKLEEYLILEEMPIPIEGKHFELKLMELKTNKATAEAMWALDSKFKPCGPWDKDVWLRGKVDAFYFIDDNTHKQAKVVDFKTGKTRPKNIEQLELYALMAMNIFEGVEKVITELWYLDSGELQTESFFIEDKANLEARWRARIRAYFIDTRFEPKPSMLCKWCHFRSDNGGPCGF